MKKLLLLIIIAVIAKLNVLAADGGKTSVRQENKVLVLSSYFQGYGWAGALESSIVSHFSVDRKWNVEVDYLDLVANRDSSFMRNKAERLMDEHDANKKNIVVLLGEEAWIMYRTYMSEEWKNVPCVAIFSGTYTISASNYSSCREITDDMKISLEDSRKGINATLINDPFFVEPTIGLALRLKPQTRHLALVSDTRLIGSCSMQASRIASEIASQTLSGCPSVTDSDVKSNFSIYLSPFKIKSPLLSGPNLILKIKSSYCSTRKTRSGWHLPYKGLP